MTVREVYQGSDGEATRALYQRLERRGAAGVVAMNLLRAAKASERAKVYRGGRGGESFRALAYQRKEWAIGQLLEALTRDGSRLQITWGWQEDLETVGFPWVLYVDLPTGQVSFHAPTRGVGPDYPGAWDRAVNMSAWRVIQFAEHVLGGR